MGCQGTTVSTIETLEKTKSKKKQEEYQTETSVQRIASFYATLMIGSCAGYCIDSMCKVSSSSCPSNKRPTRISVEFEISFEEVTASVLETYCLGNPSARSSSRTYFFAPAAEILLIPVGKGGRPSDPKRLSLAFFSFSKYTESPCFSPVCFNAINCCFPAFPTSS